MRALTRLALIALVAVSACGGVRDAIHAGPVAAAGFDARELVDVLPMGRIPAIDRPRFESIGAAGDWLADDAPVVVVTMGEDARAYPLAILLWHEVVNDVVGGQPALVTFSPLSGAAAAYGRRIGDREERFQVSGKLYRSGLVMTDRRTRSLWPQLLGRAVAGPQKDTGLTPIPAQVAPLGAFRASFPKGIVLSRETGVTRAYGFNAYGGYLSRTAPFSSFFAPRPDPRLAAMERVIGVAAGLKWNAYKVSEVMRSGVLTQGAGTEVRTVLWQRGMRSVLDQTDVSRGRDVGSVGVFTPVVGDQRLDFRSTAAGFRDRQTGSSWTVLGVATDGPMKGKRLEPLVHVDAFWFAWAGAHPDTTIAGS